MENSWFKGVLVTLMCGFGVVTVFIYMDFVGGKESFEEVMKGYFESILGKGYGWVWFS